MAETDLNEMFAPAENVTLKAFLQMHGCTISDDPVTHENLPLHPIIKGEEIVGEASEEELQTFRAIIDLDREGSGNFHHNVQDGARQALEALANGGNPLEAYSKVFSTPANCSPHMWGLRQRYLMMKQLFWYSIGERLEAHHLKLTIRAPNLIVSLGNRG